MDERCRQRNAVLRSALHTLPGSTPYENRRRLNVGGAYDGLRLGEFLQARHGHIDASVWRASAQAGRLEVDGRTVHDLSHTVRAGNQLVHVIPDEVEPEVSASLRFVHEDDDLVVLDKPAPLPVHPSGRFNKNTVLGLLAHAFDGWRVHPVHRLDADTTGVLVLAKHPAAARHLGAQFEARTVGKRYLAQVHGASPRRFDIDRAIGRRPDDDGKRTTGHGAAALTRFWTLRQGPSTSIVAAWPRSGRTNQIRVHLADAGIRSWGTEPTDRMHTENSKAEERCVCTPIRFASGIRQTTVGCGSMRCVHRGRRDASRLATRRSDVSGPQAKRPRRPGIP